jgi:hypothetical protein
MTSTCPAHLDHLVHLDLIFLTLYCQSELCYDRRSVGQSVLVSRTHLGLKARLFCVPAEGLLTWGALSDEKTGLLQCTIYLHFTCYYINVHIQHIQGFCQSRLSTADHALSLVASTYEF